MPNSARKTVLLMPQQASFTHARSHLHNSDLVSMREVGAYRIGHLHVYMCTTTRYTEFDTESMTSTVSITRAKVGCPTSDVKSKWPTWRFDQLNHLGSIRIHLQQLPNFSQVTR